MSYSRPRRARCVPRIRRSPFTLARRASRASRGSHPAIREPRRRTPRRHGGAAPGTFRRSARGRERSLPTTQRIPRFNADSNWRTRDRMLRPPKVEKDAFGRERLVTSPPVARTSMAAPRWPRGLLGRWLRRVPASKGSADATPRASSSPGREIVSDSPDPVGRWHGAAAFRRIVIAGLVVSQTYIAANFMSAVLPYHGTQRPRSRDPDPVHDPVRVGLGRLLDGDGGLRVAAFRWRPVRDFAERLTATHHRSAARASRSSCRSATRTSLRVYAGLRATYESLQRTGELDHFDFFVLSDSSDPDITRRGTRGLGRSVPRRRRLRPGLLPLAPASHQAQERQRRRLLPPLGQRLPLHGRARRRQRHERRLPDGARSR